jgi:hypothetical protein
MKRFQARRSSGRFTRNTLENTFGLRADTCPACNAFVTCRIGEAPPDTCHRCGAVIVREKCAHGRCTEPFMDPFVFNRGGYEECGKPAVAVSIDRQWGECEEHAQRPQLA